MVIHLYLQHTQQPYVAEAATACMCTQYAEEAAIVCSRGGNRMHHVAPHTSSL